MNILPIPAKCGAICSGSGEKTLAVDVSIWLTQFIKAMRDDDGKVMKNAHIIGTLRRVVSETCDTFDVPGPGVLAFLRSWYVVRFLLTKNCAVSNLTPFKKNFVCGCLEVAVVDIYAVRRVIRDHDCV